MKSILLKGIIGVLFIAASISFCKSETNGIIIPDPKVQELINTVLAHSSNNITLEEAVSNSVERFLQVNGKTKQELLIQVMLVYGGKKEYLQNPKMEMSKRFLLSVLVQDIPPLSVVAAVAPLYEQTSNPNLENAIPNILDMVIYDNGKRTKPDFNSFLPFIEQNRKDPPKKIIKYLYNRSPEEALLFFSKIYDGKPYPSDQLKGGDHKFKIKTMAAHEDWWVRLYAAMTMSHDSSVRSLDLIAQLEQDENPIVRQVVLEFLASSLTRVS